MFFFVIAGLRGLGIGSSGEAPPAVYSLKINDINSLKNVPKLDRKADPSFYRGIIAYNTQEKKDIPQGHYVWNGTKWVTVYSDAPAGSLKGDLEALHALSQLNKDNDDTKKDWAIWDIDLDNIGNPKNQKLKGVIFRNINGEPRVEALKISYYNDLRNITITKGLEALVYLTLRSSPCTQLNLSLPNLVYLGCDANNSLSVIGLECPRLAYVQIDRTTLSKMTLNCPGLDVLCAPKCLPETIDLSKCINLTELDCNSNQLSVLDLSKNTKLSKLSCRENELTELDVSQNTELTELVCSSNKLTELNVSQNTELTKLDCSSNELTTLDVSNNPKLNRLVCLEAQLERLDVSKCIELEYLFCNRNNLTELNITNSPKLKVLDCYFNKLTALDVSNNKKLVDLRISQNNLTEIDLSQNKQLEYFSFGGNPWKVAPKWRKD